MLTIQEVAVQPNSLQTMVAEVVHLNLLRLEAAVEARLNRSQVVEEVIVVDRPRLAVDSTGSRRRSSGSHRKRHMDHHRAGSHNTEPTVLHSLL
jgi:hypothetical protein